MRLPVNNDDLTTMYESLIEILSKHGEFGDVLSWVETLYSKAKFGQPSEPLKVDALDLAIMFHHAYEKLAPSMAYDTRIETRIFDPESKNGKLMIAVCQKIIDSNIFTQPSEKKALSRKEVYDWGYADGKKAQREVRYPEKMDHDHSCEFDCKGCVDSGWNQAIDEFKKLNGG